MLNIPFCPPGTCWSAADAGTDKPGTGSSAKVCPCLPRYHADRQQRTRCPHAALTTPCRLSLNRSTRSRWPLNLLKSVCPDQHMITVNSRSRFHTPVRPEGKLFRWTHQETVQLASHKGPFTVSGTVEETTSFLFSCCYYCLGGGVAGTLHNFHSKALVRPQHKALQTRGIRVDLVAFNS
ncbi:hypothetical protein BaRGS_00001418 [Batillaria attramentaria]|uniref:Uncharacterized protein n=1 Tax=Batillaria attramentaria TaxID=370345 RepID=A0ABD0M8B0_9CAEN